MKTIDNFIDGRFVPPVSGQYLDDINPATGKVLARIADSDAADVDAAAHAARRAFDQHWKDVTAEDRSRVLMRIADLIEKHADELAAMESQDNGKPIALAARMDIPRAVLNFRFFATAILHTSGAIHRTDNRALNYTLRKPVGVAGLISPWNLPLYLLSWKIAPALASGNCCVAKPSELTPLTAHRLAELTVEAGLPAGVMNIVQGLGSKAGEAITSHPGIPAISFTGGTVTGAAVMRAAGPLFKKVSLELGGKNPNIVFDDADLDEAIPMSIQSSFANQGEICLCGSRLFVGRKIHDAFIEEFVARTKQLKVGDPSSPDTDVGALISKEHLQKVTGHIEAARDEKATVLTGGTIPGNLPAHLRGGFFMNPTVITGAESSCRIMQEEVFGPVVTITPFDSDEEAIALANGTRYGLSSSIWTRDLQRAHRVAAAIDTGTVWVNSWLLRDLRVPFGGMKESGLGREGGFESLNLFTEEKTVCIKL